MIWIIAISIVGYIAFRFFSDVNKDNDDLRGQNLNEKFKIISGLINDAAFNGLGKVVTLDKRSFNVYQDGKNQIVHFFYSTGHLTITWKYKYFQKEVVHEKNFRDVRNLSIFEQQRIAEIMINEMANVIQKHQNAVVGF
jgi:hypothetical protein